MKKLLIIATVAILPILSVNAEAQNSIRYGVANSTPYMVPRYVPSPRVQQFIMNRARMQPFTGPIMRGVYGQIPAAGRVLSYYGAGTAATAGAAAAGANLLFPSKAYAPGVATGTATTTRRFYNGR